MLFNLSILMHILQSTISTWHSLNILVYNAAHCQKSVAKRLLATVAHVTAQPTEDRQPVLSLRKKKKQQNPKYQS